MLGQEKDEKGGKKKEISFARFADTNLIPE